MEAMVGIVTYAKPWSLIEDKTGELKEGITVEYQLVDSLLPLKNEDGSRGTPHSKESINVNKISSVKEIPGFYNMKFDFKPGIKGRIQLKLTDIEFLSTLIPLVDKPGK